VRCPPKGKQTEELVVKLAEENGWRQSFYILQVVGESADRVCWNVCRKLRRNPRRGFGSLMLRRLVHLISGKSDKAYDKVSP